MTVGLGTEIVDACLGWLSSLFLIVSLFVQLFTSWRWQRVSGLSYDWVSDQLT
jgi:hypothetical protein